MFVESDHAGDRVSCRSRSGFLIYVNTALVRWFSMKQSTVETSVFGAEFVTMKQGIDALRGLRYKLRMMGIPISGPICIYGDNMSVVNNTSKPMGEFLVGHIPSKENVADLMTKFCMDIRGDIWSVIFFMIFITSISYQY